MGRFCKKMVVLAAFIGFGIALLSGCGRREPQIVETRRPEEITITILASRNWIKEIDRQLFQEFEEETGIEVKLLLTPDSGYGTLLGTCMSGGSDAVDIFMFSAGSGVIETGIHEIAVDLSEEEWVDELEEWALKSVRCEGKVIGLNTWGEDYEGILYNKTFFQEHGLEVPDTWEDFLSLCDRICELGTVPFYEGINSSWRTKSWVYGLTPALYQEIPELPEYLNAGAQHKFGDIAAFREGLEQIREFFSEKKYYTSDGRDEEFQGSYQYLTERKAVMLFTYSAYAAELKAHGSRDAWGMFPAPLLDNQTAVSNGGGIAKFINKNSRNVQACKELFRFLTRKENLERYYKARTDLVTSAFQNVKSVQATEATKEILDRSKETPCVMFTKDVLYTDSNVYQDISGFADGTCSVKEFIRKYDEYREKMFQADP